MLEDDTLNYYDYYELTSFVKTTNFKTARLLSQRS